MTSDVRAAALVDIAFRHGWLGDVTKVDLALLERAAAKVIAAAEDEEREACAKECADVARNIPEGDGRDAAQLCADRIRTRRTP